MNKETKLKLLKEKITKELNILTNTSTLFAGINNLPFDETINIIIDTLQNELENVKLAYEMTNNERKETN